jgi:hypothetical protein
MFPTDNAMRYQKFATSDPEAAKAYGFEVFGQYSVATKNAFVPDP